MNSSNDDRDRDAKARKTRKGRVVGIGGIFFKTADTGKTRAWYQQHLGLNTDEYGTNFEWRQADDSPADGQRKGFTQWSPFAADTGYFAPSDKDFMINYRVVNLEALLEQLRSDGISIVGEVETYEYGKFAHIMDLDGHKIELWEPNDIEYEKITDGRTR